MKTLSLRPYHGEIRLFVSLAELRREYRRLTKQKYPYADDEGGGRYIKLEFGDKAADNVWLVFYATQHALAHEIAHVLFKTFHLIGHDQREGDGEPFCYMLSQLVLEANSE